MRRKYSRTNALFSSMPIALPPRRSLGLAALHHLHLLLELRLQRLQVEAGALLHRRIVEEGLRVAGDRLLHVDEAPELVGEPVVEGERAAESGALEGVEPEVH